MWVCVRACARARMCVCVCVCVFCGAGDCDSEKLASRENVLYGMWFRPYHLQILSNLKHGKVKHRSVCAVVQTDLSFYAHTIGIKHGFPCINVCQVPRKMLKTEAVGRGFQHLPRDLANVNVLEKNV